MDGNGLEITGDSREWPDYHTSPTIFMRGIQSAERLRSAIFMHKSLHVIKCLPDWQNTGSVVHYNSHNTLMMVRKPQFTCGRVSALAIVQADILPEW